MIDVGMYPESRLTLTYYKKKFFEGIVFFNLF